MAAKTGRRGPKGAHGARGERGERGETGERGQAGERGEAGERGVRGRTGRRGATGARGPAGRSPSRAEIVAAVAEQFADVRGQLDLQRRQLDVQLTRFAQLQAQLDHIEKLLKELAVTAGV